MLLTLGTSNVGQVRNKKTPPLMLPWYYFRPQSLSAMNRISDNQIILLETREVPILPYMYISSPAHWEQPTMSDYKDKR